MRERMRLKPKHKPASSITASRWPSLAMKTLKVQSHIFTNLSLSSNPFFLSYKHSFLFQPLPFIDTQKTTYHTSDIYCKGGGVLKDNWASTSGVVPGTNTRLFCLKSFFLSLNPPPTTKKLFWGIFAWFVSTNIRQIFSFHSTEMNEYKKLIPRLYTFIDRAYYILKWTYFLYIRSKMWFNV